jgi:biopolymer transport protein ExbD
MAFSGGGKGLRSDINVTPLIDVVLVLLIVFMVLVPKLLNETPVDVPPKAPPDTAMQPPSDDQLVVSISEDGRVAINNEAVTMAELPERVRKLMENRSKKLMFFSPEDSANYGTVAKVMDICRGSGVKILGIMTKS